MAEETSTRSLESEGMSSVYRFAVELVEETRRANEARLADARDLATVVSIADPAAADRIIEATEEGNQRDLAVAERQAEELVNFARNGILSAVQRYASGLVEEQRRIAENRMPRAQQLAELIRAADPDAAERMLKAIEEVHKSSLETAEQQAKAVVDLARSRLERGGPTGHGGAEWAPAEDHERPGAPARPVPAPPMPTPTHIDRSFQEAFQRGPAGEAEPAARGDLGVGESGSGVAEPSEHVDDGDGGSAGEER